MIESSGESPVSILFISHVGQINEEYAPIARELRRSFDLRTILWTLGGRDYRTGLESNAFDQVVNLMKGFDKFKAISEITCAENFKRLVELERHLGCIFYHQDAALDRSFTGFTSAEMDYSSMGTRWTYQQIAAVSVHLVERVREELKRSKIILAIGETNTHQYRLIHRILNSQGITELCPTSVPHEDEHTYFEDELASAWKGCRELYSRYRNKGIPEDLQALAEAKLEEICIHHVKPGYYLKLRQGPRRWMERISPNRITRGLHDWWEAMRSKEQQSNPRSLPAELLSPGARLARALRVHHRNKFYEKVAQRSIPQQKYACYFLHMQPEVTVEAWAFEYQDQVALIRNIVAALPADTLLLVKEHKVDAGRRPVSFYGELVSIPNVVLIHDTLDSLELIQQASVVFTLTGTVALESICFGVPCIVFGNIYYECFKGIYKAQSISHLREILSEPSSLRGASREEALAALAARNTASYRAIYPGNPDDQDNIGRLVSAIEQECRMRGIILPSPQNHGKAPEGQP
jgi:hypothetical protein